MGELTGKLIKMKDVESVMKVLKLELGEVTDIQGFQNVDKEGEDAVEHLVNLKQKENEEYQKSIGSPE